MTTYVKLGLVVFWIVAAILAIKSIYMEPSRRSSFNEANTAALLQAVDMVCKELGSIAKCSEIEIGGKNQPIGSATLTSLDPSAIASCEAINYRISSMAVIPGSGGFYRLKIDGKRISVKCDATLGGEQKLIGMLAVD